MSLYGFFFYLQKYTADQTLVQRYLVAKSDREALKGVALGAILCVPAWAAFMLVGTLLWAYYQLSGETLPAHLHDAAGKIMPDKVFPFFLATKIPAGLAGLFMAALFSAGMSTMSSDLNCLCRRRRGGLLPQAAAELDRPPAACRRQNHRGRLRRAGHRHRGAHRVEKRPLAVAVLRRVRRSLPPGWRACFLLAFFSRRANRQGLWIGHHRRAAVHRLGDA